MFTIFSILSIRRARSPGSSMMLKLLIHSVSTKSSSMNMPMGVMLNRSFFGSFLVMLISVTVAIMSSAPNNVVWYDDCE